MYNILFLFLMAVFLFSSCEKFGLCEDDELSLERVDYTGNQLRIDGYYFGDVNPNSTKPFANIYYFYENGVFFTSEAANLDQAESGTIVVDIENTFGKKIKGAWGVFQINGSLIEIERWQSRMSGCETSLYERGNILNDSTFVLTRREARENGKAVVVKDINSIFKFRPLPEKPDSSNSFIN